MKKDTEEAMITVSTTGIVSGCSIHLSGFVRVVSIKQRHRSIRIDPGAFPSLAVGVGRRHNHVEEAAVSLCITNDCHCRLRNASQVEHVCILKWIVT